MNIYSQIESNKRKTWLIMALFIALIGTLGYVFGEVQGSPLLWFGFAMIFSGGMTFVSYYNSDKIVLNLSGARRITEQEFPLYYRAVENLCIATGTPMPRLYVIEDEAMNAFATGRDPNHSAIAATRGLLEKLDKREIEGVMAHELSHVRNFDIRLMAIVAILVGSIALLADIFMRSMWYGGDNRRDRGSGAGVIVLIGIILAILSPIVAQLIKLAVSRNREYLADASAALITRNPDALASALEKISSDPGKLDQANSATAHMYISNPLKSDKLHRLFSTHPPAEERIKRLRSM